MSVTVWLLVLAAIVYLFGRRRRRRNVMVVAQLIGVAAVCLVVGQVAWQLLGP
ncbi:MULTISPECIES: hypothetical protein [Nocardiaceae]|uniref:hypothetical protein n=1 Tax=Nocardiaceae TaxID=85025 RepID=UPI00037DFF8E|nr:MULTISPECIES: hypothetical protein [Rhodococcus]